MFFARLAPGVSVSNRHAQGSEPGRGAAERRRAVNHVHRTPGPPGQRGGNISIVTVDEVVAGAPSVRPPHPSARMTLSSLTLLAVVLLSACQDVSSPTQPQNPVTELQTQTETQTAARAQVMLDGSQRHTSTAPAREGVGASDLSGSYLLTISESCGAVTSSGLVTVVQTGTSIRWLLGVDTGGVEGTIQTDTIFLTWSKESDAGLLCGSQLAGTAAIKGRTIIGKVSGDSNAHSCFRCASDTITFTLVRH